jgi:hypothetical protein
MQLMELEIERKPQEIRCEGRKLPAQLIPTTAAVVFVALRFSAAIAGSRVPSGPQLPL